MFHKIKNLLKKTSFIFIFVALSGGGMPEVQSAQRQALTLEANTAEVQKFQSDVRGVFVANPDIADIQISSPKVAYIFAKKTGSTTVFATDSEGAVVLNLDITVVDNLTQINKVLKMVAPNQNVKALSTPRGIILQGDVASAKEAADLVDVASRYIGDRDQIINNLKVSTPSQVYLKVKVAEVNRSALNHVGIDWGQSLSAKNFTFGLVQGAAPIDTDTSTFRRATNGSTTYAGIGAQFNDGTTNIAGLIELLNTQGLATILAEPTLVAMSGETASFLAGGEYPYPVPQDTNITIDFKQFGISLAFTPTVLSSNQINLRVRPEVSELDQSNKLSIPTSTGAVTVPALKTRRAETSVELGSGQSLAIAGLFSNSIQSSIQELPGLADIPILGALFRSTDFQRNETELVIIVTPYIVKPTSTNSLESPTSGVVHTTNLEKILFARLSKAEPSYQSTMNQTPQLKGVAGFYVE